MNTAPLLPPTPPLARPSFGWSPTSSSRLQPAAANATRRGRRVPPAHSLLTFAALSLALAGCGKHEPATNTAPELPPAQVQLATARLHTGPATVEITGTVRPVQRAVLAAKLMGAIEELAVTLGQQVKAGDVLAQIAAGEIRARLLQAQSQLNVARRDLERERELLGKGASTADLVKGLEDRLAMTQAMVREAEVMLGYATVRAPFDGVVSRKLANAGDLASPGVPLLEVEGTNAFEIEAGLPDSLAAGLELGMPIPVLIPATGQAFTGTLAEVSSAADPVTRSVTAKVAVPASSGARSGQFVRLQLPGPSVRVLLIPAAAVSPFGQLERVYVASLGRVQLRIMKTGARRGANIEIAAGIDDGEQVVLNPPAALRDGQRIEVQP